jgi:hypothetical protein
METPLCGSLQQQEMYMCCSKDCPFPVLILEGGGSEGGGVAGVTTPLRHGSRGVCLNWTLAQPHAQRYCSNPCDRFVRVDHFGRWVYRGCLCAMNDGRRQDLVVS